MNADEASDELALEVASARARHLAPVDHLPYLADTLGFVLDGI